VSDTFKAQVAGLVCPHCRGFKQLSFPVDSEGNWERCCDDGPYCGNCGRHVVPVVSKRKRKGDNQLQTDGL